MKINSKADATLRYAFVQNENGKAKEAKTAQSKDSITISPAARLLQECLATEEPFNSAKVEELKDALEKGEYQVDASLLANKLLSEVVSQRGLSK